MFRVNHKLTVIFYIFCSMLWLSLGSAVATPSTQTKVAKPAQATAKKPAKTKAAIKTISTKPRRETANTGYRFDNDEFLEFMQSRYTFASAGKGIEQKRTRLQDIKTILRDYRLQLSAAIEELKSKMSTEAQEKREEAVRAAEAGVNDETTTAKAPLAISDPESLTNQSKLNQLELLYSLVSEFVIAYDLIDDFFLAKDVPAILGDKNKAASHCEQFRKELVHIYLFNRPDETPLPPWGDYVYKLGKSVCDGPLESR